MLNAQNKEYRTRSQISFEIASDPSRALDTLHRRALIAYNRGAVHYDRERGIRCGSGLLLMSLSFGHRANKQRMIAEPMTATGGNYSPYKGAPKHCGEMNAKEELKPTDIVAPLVVVIGPKTSMLREIEGSRPLEVGLHNCVRCRGLFEGNVLSVIYDDENPDPLEALSIDEMNTYHGNPDSPYPWFGTDDPKGRALEVLGSFSRNVVSPLIIAQLDMR